MKYKFIGNGMGVPGLPHEISDEEAEQLGVAELLRNAVSNGNYVPATPRPDPLPKREREKVDKEVTHG